LKGTTAEACCRRFEQFNRVKETWADALAECVRGHAIVALVHQVLNCVNRVLPGNDGNVGVTALKHVPTKLGSGENVASGTFWHRHEAFARRVVRWIPVQLSR
jgi:hypothetical protein